VLCCRSNAATCISLFVANVVRSFLCFSSVWSFAILQFYNCANVWKHFPVRYASLSLRRVRHPLCTHRRDTIYLDDLLVSLRAERPYYGSCLAYANDLLMTRSKEELERLIVELWCSENAMTVNTGNTNQQECQSVTALTRIQCFRSMKGA
jgi:hypothetical protein